MSKYVCLKCGSRLVDDGTNHFASLIGVCLFISGLVILLFTGWGTPAVSDWLNYSPLEGQNLSLILPIVVAISLSQIVIITGMERSERVHCRHCGSVWTPPRPVAKVKSV